MIYVPTNTYSHKIAPFSRLKLGAFPLSASRARHEKEREREREIMITYKMRCFHWLICKDATRDALSENGLN